MGLDLADYNTIFQHQGDVVGYVKYLKVENIIDEILLPLKNKLIRAKGVLLEFYIGEGTSKYSCNLYMDTFYDLLNKDAEFISYVNESENLEDGFISCRIILTGL